MKALKEEPSILNEEKMEIFLSFLEGTLNNASETVDNDLIKKHFKLLKYYLETCKSLKIAKEKSKSKPLSSNKCYIPFKNKLKEIIQLLKEDNYNYKSYQGPIIRLSKDSFKNIYFAYNDAHSNKQDTIEKIIKKLKKSFKPQIWLTENSTIEDDQSDEETLVVDADVDDNSYFNDNENQNINENYQTSEEQLQMFVELTFIEEDLIRQLNE